MSMVFWPPLCLAKNISHEKTIKVYYEPALFASLL
jgi:hypothetical protein